MSRSYWSERFRISSRGGSSSLPLREPACSVAAYVLDGEGYAIRGQAVLFML